MSNTPLPEALTSEAAPGFGHNSGATPPAETPSTTPDLLRGAGEICVELYGADTPSNRRRLYYEQESWPLFRLEPDGVLHALRSRLRSFLTAKSIEREAQISAAAALSEAEIPRQSKLRWRTASTPPKAPVHCIAI
jgi:hypothetical protein